MTKYTNTLPDSPITSVTVNIENDGELGPYLIIMHKQCNIIRTISGSAIADFVNEACIKADNIIDKSSIDKITKELEDIITCEDGQYTYRGDQINSIDMTTEIMPSGSAWRHNKPSYTSDSLNLNQKPIEALCYEMLLNNLTSRYQEKVFETIETVIAGDCDPGYEGR